MFELSIFSVVAIVFAIWGVRMVRKSAKGWGEALVAASLLIGMAGVHTCHTMGQRRASRMMAAACVVIDQRIVSGEIEEVRGALGYGIRVFTKAEGRLATNIEAFWEEAIRYPESGFSERVDIPIGGLAD
ncbi:MAG: hypothetical protein ACNA8L_01530 [Luteolibacter sp.]|jgi:hypothetical protein